MFHWFALGVLSVALAVFFTTKKSSTPATSTSTSTSTPKHVSSSQRDPISASLRTKHALKAGEIRHWTTAEIAIHNKITDCWIIIDDKVYDVTDYVDEHAGGVEAITRHAGGDATAGFHGPQHPDKVHQILPDFYIGEYKRDTKKAQ